jgi:hypothetical protein
MSQQLYTTIEVSKAAGVPRSTMQYWIKTGKISAPRVRLLRNRAVRLWTEAQKTRIRTLGGTFKSGPKKKARGRERSKGSKDERTPLALLGIS